ncbi:MAG: hypothetical protein ACQEQI_06645 [Bacillota bacterium]
MELVILLLVLLGLGVVELGELKRGLTSFIEFGDRYASVLSLLTNLVLAYATWKYVTMGKKTLEFMKESFTKEYEEDIKFMFITQLKRELTKDLTANPKLVRGDLVDQDLAVLEDKTYLYIDIFNSGRRLVSHIQLDYRLLVFTADDDLIIEEEIEVVIPVTIEPNDYISLPLVYVKNLPQIEIIMNSVRSFNGLGKEQLLNSPQRKLEYQNRNLKPN